MASASRRTLELRAGTDSRRNTILQLARDHGVVRVSELSRRFDISEVSIRRDLAKLEEYGLLRRVHGGAVSAPGSAGARTFDSRSASRLDEKRRIGQVAAQLVERGDCIILDSGTTVLQVARHIARIADERGPLTVITPSLAAFRELAHVRGLQLFVLGGIYQPDYQTLVGPQTLANLRGFHVDKLFLGADGLSLEHGVTTADILEAEVSRAMVQIADRIIVVADSSKVNSAGFTSIIPLSRMTTLVTDAATPQPFVDNLRMQGVEVVAV